MKTIVKTLALVLAIIMAFAMLSGCSANKAPAPDADTPAAPAAPDAAPADNAEKSDITIGVSLATATNNPHIVMVADSLKKAIEAEGWTCILQDADNDSAKQSTQFDNLVTMEVDLIAYWANDRDAAVADVKKAADAGIPVIAYFSDPAEEAHQYIECYVGADQKLIAGELAVVANELLGGSGNIVIVNGKEGKSDFVDRSEGFREKIATLGDYTILAEEYCDSDRTQAQSIMENFLTTYPDLNLVFTCSDDFGFGAFNALEAAGKTGDIKIVSIDGLAEVLEQIKAGAWDCSILQTPGMMADKFVEVAHKVLDGEKISEYNQNTDYYIVTAANVDDYLN